MSLTWERHVSAVTDTVSEATASKRDDLGEPPTQCKSS